MADRHAVAGRAAPPVPARPPILVYIEIPECGAAALYAGFRANRPRAGERAALDEVFAGGGGIEHGDMKQLRRAAKKLRVKGLRVLRGRFPFAVSKYLAQLEDKRDLRYITFLREPVDRAIAEYLRATEGSPMTFDDALGAGLVYDNVQTRMLSSSESPRTAVTDDTLAEAKRNLRDRFSYVGLFERLDESLVLARRRLDLRDALYRSRTAASTTVRGRDVAVEVGAWAERSNQYDLELYRYSQDLFGAAPELDDLEFQVELAVMRGVRRNADIASVPPPPGFNGGEEEWRMLAEARSEILRLEWELEDGTGPAAADDGLAPHEAADG